MMFCACFRAVLSRDEQPVGDFLVGAPFGHDTEHLELPAAQVRTDSFTRELGEEASRAWPA